MRHVPGLALAAIAAIAFLACGETQEVTQSDSPGATTPAASGPATPTESPGATATASPTPSSAAVSDTPTPIPTAVYEWVSPTPEVPREDLGDSWYSPAFDEDASKPKIGEQVLNGILIGAKGLFPQPELCEDDPDSHETIHPDEIAAAVNGTAVDIRPAYLPEGVELEMQEARACQGQVINLVRGYVVESRPDPGGTLIPAWAGGGITISRTLTSKSQFSLIGVAERVHAATIGGYPAVLVEPLTPLGYDIGIGSAHIVVRDGETVTSIEGDGLPFGELLAIAESLWIDK